MNFIAWTIVACEIGFWIFILLGLIARYVFKREGLGLLLLAMTPVVDLVLLLVTGIDVYRGATATVAHSIAPLYIGVSLVYGKSMIQWSDQRFRYYVKKEGDKPKRLAGMAHAWHSMKGSLKHILAYIIGGALLLLMIYVINDSNKTEALYGTLKLWGIIVVIDNLISLSYFIWPRPERAQ